MNEYETEPVRGLPQELPEGEHIMWQGEPRWQDLARYAFHVRAIVLYFGLLIVGHVVTRLFDGATALEVITGALGLGLLAGAAVGVLSFLAWLYARTTVYTITNHRLVMRFGVAIQMMVNIPWAKIDSVDAKLYRDGTGDIMFKPIAGEKMSYWILWPHARPWHFSRVQPMLRCLPGAREVAARLASVLEAEHGVASVPSLPADQPRRAPAGSGIRTAAAS